MGWSGMKNETLIEWVWNKHISFSFSEHSKTYYVALGQVLEPKKYPYPLLVDESSDINPINNKTTYGASSARDAARKASSLNHSRQSNGKYMILKHDPDENITVNTGSMIYLTLPFLPQRLASENRLTDEVLYQRILEMLPTWRTSWKRYIWIYTHPLWTVQIQS